MTDRQLALIDKINNYINDEEDDLYLDFDDYRELNDWLQKSLKLKELIKDLFDVADTLCDRMIDFPAGCDACSLYTDDYDYEDGCTFCEFEKIRERYEEVMK